MKRITFIKIYDDKVHLNENSITEEKLNKTFDECVESFEKVCKEFGEFERNGYISAKGNALGTIYMLEVEDA